ncbi:MAG: SPOR domain-containing protein [Novosphingobium sp.]|nr:SPOR domain-containing protein [Novosphingobium sp.]
MIPERARSTGRATQQQGSDEVTLSDREIRLVIVWKSSRICPALLAVSAIFFIAPPAIADIKAGVDAWSAGDYGSAVKQWKGPADRGDADAQFNMEQAYKLGRGVDQDLAKAEFFYEAAAAKGHLRASDNLGLLLFQRGERTKAMPFIHAASGRGDPRAQYVLGLNYFNGDHVPKDWVRAYALVSLANQAGLGQARSALTQMDKHVPLEQRQQSVQLASQLAQQAAANRASQVAALDLGTQVPAAAVTSGPQAPSVASAQQAAASAAMAAGSTGPATAGADFARPASPAVAAAKPPKGWIEIPAQAEPKPVPKPAPAPKPAPVAKPAPATAAQGPWRVQLGAFGVAGNANRLWSKLAGRAELSGRTKLLVPAGRLTKLQAGGFASRADANSACAGLKSAGYACMALKD